MPAASEFQIPLSGVLYTQQQFEELEEKDPSSAPQLKKESTYILQHTIDVTDEEAATMAVEGESLLSHSITPL